MTPIELLAIAIAPDEHDIDDWVALSRELLQEVGGIRGLGDVPPSKAANKGVGPLDWIRFKAAMELGRRSGNTGRGDRRTITDSSDVLDEFPELREAQKEHFCALLLDTKNKVLRKVVVHIGTLDASIVGIREFFREALIEGAASVIAVHNHPSGDPTPSKEDFEVTRILAQAGKMLEIPLLDHIIIGGGDYRSLQKLGAIG